MDVKDEAFQVPPPYYFAYEFLKISPLRIHERDSPYVIKEVCWSEENRFSFFDVVVVVVVGMSVIREKKSFSADSAEL